VRLTPALAPAYARLALRRRRGETRLAAAAVRRGATAVLGLHPESTALRSAPSSAPPALALIAPAVAEEMSCGRAEVDVASLRAVARHR